VPAPEKKNHYIRRVKTEYKMAKVTFKLKEPKIKDETLVYMVINYNNKRLKYSTGERIKPAFWNTADHKAKETKKFSEYPEFNARLELLKSNAFTAYRKILNDGDEPTNGLLKKELDKIIRFSESAGKPDLFSFIDKFIEECRPIKAKGTILVYERAKKHLENFCKSVNKKIDFSDIDLEFYNSFIGYLTKEDYSQNTIGKQIKVLKTFLNEATERGINTTVEFKKKKFKRPTEEPEKIYLNMEEIDKIYKLDLSKDKQLDEIRDLFIIGCFTGLRFSDFSQLKPENIMDGNKIRIRTSKTNELVIIPLHKYVKEIISKYNNKLPKALSNPKMNLNLKHLGSLAKITDKMETAITKGGQLKKEAKEKYKLIGTHTARRSFATNLYLAGVPSITIMKITGHQTEKNFLRYIRISQEENANKLLDHPFFK
jgi:integrase